MYADVAAAAGIAEYPDLEVGRTELAHVHILLGQVMIRIGIDIRVPRGPIHAHPSGGGSGCRQPARASHSRPVYIMCPSTPLVSPSRWLQLGAARTLLKGIGQTLHNVLGPRHLHVANALHVLALYKHATGAYHDANVLLTHSREVVAGIVASPHALLLRSALAACINCRGPGYGHYMRTCVKRHLRLTPPRQRPTTALYGPALVQVLRVRGRAPQRRLHRGLGAVRRRQRARGAGHPRPSPSYARLGRPVRGLPPASPGTPSPSHVAPPLKC